MPKKESQNDRAKKYFKLHNNDEKTYKCSIDGCAKIIHGNNPSSFVSHIKHIHKSIYRMEINQEAVDEKTIQLKRLQLIQHCAEIVSVNGRPLNYLRDSGFQNIIADQTDFLNANKSGINFHTLTEIKQYLFDSEEKMREIMKKEVADRFVSLMIDIGSKNNVSLLSICTQFIIEERIQIRNIGMVQLHKRHKSSYIKQMIADQLDGFELEKPQVVSLTTDNANNMRATVKLFDDDIDVDGDEAGAETAELDETAIQERVQTLQINSETQCDFDNIRLRDILRQYSNVDDDAVDDTLLSILDDQSVFAEVAESVELDFRKSTFNVNGVPCSAHTLQLAVNEALEIPSAEIIISLCRLAAKLLRREIYAYELIDAGIFIKAIRLNCAVRWSSTYRMVRHFSIGKLQLRDIY